MDESFETRGWMSPPSRWTALKSAARRLRRDATPAEQRLWSALRGNALGVRLRRQHAIGQFIVDFYCPAAKLVIEVDGSAHRGKEDDDRARQAYLEGRGLHVLRFSNEAVLHDLESVLEQIATAVNLTP